MKLRARFAWVGGIITTSMLIVTPAVSWAQESRPQPQPPETRAPAPALPPLPAPPGSSVTGAAPLACDKVAAAGQVLAKNGNYARAVRDLVAATRTCSDNASVWRELAALRLADSKWTEAEHYAQQATRLADDDERAWRILAHSRYLKGDVRGALAAWNRVGLPLVDRVEVRGARHTQRAVVSELSGLEPGQLLSPNAFLQAQHRVELLPVSFDTRIKYEPLENGRARVDVLLDERDVLPRSWVPLAYMGATAAFLDYLSVEVAGPTGHGEDLTGTWRWAKNSRLVDIALAMPAPGRLPGVLTLEGVWERQVYDLTSAVQVAEDRRHLGLGLTDWATSWLRWEGTVAADRFGENNYAGLNGGAEGRLVKDHLSIGLTGGAWAPIDGANQFGAGRLWVGARSSTNPDRPMVSLIAGASIASDDAPLSLWPGAGSTLAREGLLRAHTLRRDGRISGEAFGRRLTYQSIEYMHPLSGAPGGKMAVAVFADAARASNRASGLPATPVLVDVGVGLRVHASVNGVIRVDVARGIQDGRMQMSIGMMPRWPKLGF